MSDEELEEIWNRLKDPDYYSDYRYSSIKSSLNGEYKLARYRHMGLDINAGGRH